MVNKIESKCDLNPETTVDNGANVEHIAAVSRTFKTNNTKLVKCQNYGIQHPVRKSPAFVKACFNSRKLNHYAEFCRGTRHPTLDSLLAALKKSSSVQCNANVLKHLLVNIAINGVHSSGLLDTGASDCFMTTKPAKRLGLKIKRFFDGKVEQEDRELKSNVIRKTRSNLVVGNEKFLCKNVEFTLLNNLVKEVIIRLKVLKQHQSITLDFERKHRPLNFKHENESNLSVVFSNVKFPALIPGIDENTEPIKMPSRKYAFGARLKPVVG